MIYKDISHNPDRIMSDDGNGWEMIVAAIIERAVKDYKVAFFANNSRQMKEIERFILSKYFNTISLIEPHDFIKKLREKFAAEKKAKERKKKQVSKGTKHDK